MSYVIYHKETTILLIEKSYNSERAAKSHCTKICKTKELNRDEYAVTDGVNFKENIEKEVERINLMSGEKFMEPINTPICCSPAFETYWCM